MRKKEKTGQLLNKFFPPPPKKKKREYRLTELLNFLFLLAGNPNFVEILSLSLFVMLVTNPIFFSFFKSTHTQIYFTQGEYGPWNTNLGPPTERKQIFV